MHSFVQDVAPYACLSMLCLLYFMIICQEAVSFSRSDFRILIYCFKERTYTLLHVWL